MTATQLSRLQSLQLPALLKAAPKHELQNILKLVCSIFNTNHALIALLFDRQVYITNGTGSFQEGDFPWRYSFCGWTMASEQHTVMVINDAEKDARFCNSPVAKKYGVRFYAGAPLVSSRGHRLGTLCFADTQPRIFEDSSLRILCNFSELVTRELERNIALAETLQQHLPPGLHEDAAAAAAHQQIAAARSQKGQQLLRSLDCVTSAVLLVDAAQPGWNVLYANRGWQLLLQLCQNVLAGDSANVQPAQQVASIVGQTLWPAVSQQLQEKAANCAGQSHSDRLLQLVKERKSFTLSGIALANLGGAAVTMSFRSAELGNIEGAVSLCLPSYVPDSQATPAAGGMYFVTVHLQRNQATGLATVIEVRDETSSIASTPGNAITAPWTAQGDAAAAQGVSLSTVRYPQLGQQLQTGQQLQQCKQGFKQEPELLVLTSVRFRQASAQAPIDPLDPGSNSWKAPNLLDNTTSRLPVITFDTSGSLELSSSNNSSNSNSLLKYEGGTSATAARLVCKRIDGLRLGGQVAAGSYGRVFRGDYLGTKVAVKVLDGDAVLRRESATSLCLEALLGEQLKHPNVVSTLAWAVVTGKDRLPKAQKLWGETLDCGRPRTTQQMPVAAAATSNVALTAAGPAAAPAGPASSDGESEQGVPDMVDFCAADEFEESSGSSILEGQTWLVMEYMDKGCLQDAVDCGWLRDSVAGPVSLLKVIATANEVASGILTLHKAGVVHGDLSAFNVLLSSNDASAVLGGRGFVAKISDFGLSRPLEQKSKVITKTYGTITHMPPELLEQGIISKAADVYSFGVLLWQMVSSSRAWAGMSHQAVVKAVCIDKLQLQFPADAPEALVALGQACMAYDPAERPTLEDILEVLAPLNEFIVSAEINAMRPGARSVMRNGVVNNV